MCVFGGYFLKLVGPKSILDLYRMYLLTVEKRVEKTRNEQVNKIDQSVNAIFWGKISLWKGRNFS